MFKKWKTSIGIVSNLKPLIIVAQLSLVVYFLLSRFSIPRTEFIQGMLLGFSLVGNIAGLIQSRKQ